MNQRDKDAPETAIGNRVFPGSRFRRPSWKPLVFVLAVVLSPVAGLMFGLDIALGILVVAMAFTTWMAWEGASHVSAEDGQRLRKAAMLNGAIAVAGVVLIILRQVV